MYPTLLSLLKVTMRSVRSNLIRSTDNQQVTTCVEKWRVGLLSGRFATANHSKEDFPNKPGEGVYSYTRHLLPTHFSAHAGTSETTR